MFREKATCARLQGPLSRVVTSSILGPLRQDNLLLPKSTDKPGRPSWCMYLVGATTPDVHVSLAGDYGCWRDPPLQRLSLPWIKSRSKLCGVNETAACQECDFSFAVVEGGSSRVR